MVQCPYRDLWKALHCLSPLYLASLVCYWNASSHLWLSSDNIPYHSVIEFFRQVSRCFLPCCPFMHGRSSLKRAAIPSQDVPWNSSKMCPPCYDAHVQLWQHWDCKCFETTSLLAVKLFSLFPLLSVFVSLCSLFLSLRCGKFGAFSALCESTCIVQYFPMTCLSQHNLN